MKSAKYSKLGLLSALLVLGCGTMDGAHAGLLGGNKPGSPAQSTTDTDSSSPEALASSARIDKARTNLDQARRQLDAAKAVLKAADAEFRAARADQEALSLRTQAQKLADSSGLQGVPMDRVQGVQQTSKFLPGPAVTPTPTTPTGDDRIDPTETPATDPDSTTPSAAVKSAPVAPTGNPPLRQTIDPMGESTPDGVK
jgi:multidrug efflux pump subunit AcrA (membrane-fusion protein)